MSAELVGLVGYAQVGKDTAAQALTALGYQQIAFADALRDLAMDVNPIIAGIPYDRWVSRLGYERAKSEVPGFRDFLKKLGNGVRKHVDPEAWIHAALRRASGLTVVSDVRFLNEAQAIVTRGGVLLRVVRPDHGPESDFEREVALIGCDVEITNDGSIESFQRSVQFAINPLLAMEHGINQAEEILRG